MQLDLLIKSIARKIGIDIRAYRPARSEGSRLERMLRCQMIDTVLDVGASRGQYARYLRSIGYQGRIICFEPLQAAHAALTRFAGVDRGITVAPRMALGEDNGVIEINVSANSESSSVLLLTDAHLQAEPRVRYIATETVELARLDVVAPKFLIGGEKIFLKLDVQGYELQVLHGAFNLLPLITGIQLELSLEPLYQEEPLYRDMIDLLELYGFVLYDINPCFSDGITGRTYQVDAVFFRKQKTQLR